MKNKTVIMIQIAVLTLIFVLLCGIGAAMITKGSFIGVINFPFGNMSDSKLTMSESYSFSNIKDIQVDAITYSVYVQEHDSQDVIVEEYISDDKEKDKTKVYSQDGTVYFKQEKRISFINIYSGKIIIKVPQGSTLDYTIGSVSGKIEVDAKSKELDIDSTSGSIQVHQRGEEVEANTVSGSVKIYSPFNKIKSDTISGSIKLTADQNTTEISADTVSGSIKMELYNDVGYIMDYSSVSGSIKDEYRGTRYGKSGVAKQGNNQIDIEASTISGSIKLEDWQ